MSRISELIVKIRGDVSGALKGIREVSGEMGKLSRETSGAFSGFNDAFAKMSSFGSRMTVGLTLPIAAVGAAAVKADADLDALERGLVAVSGSSSEAQRQLKRLEEVAKLPGLGFREAVQGSINLQAAGLSAQTAERALGAFGNALATVGKSKADLDGVILALGQIESKGKISAEEINQLAERVPQIRQAMKAAFATANTEELQKMGLSSTEFINKIIAEFEKLPKAGGGVKNAFENVQDSVQKSLAEIGRSMRPATEAFLGAAEPLIQKIGEVAKGMRDWDPAAQVAVGGLITLAGGIGPVLAGLGQLGLAITGIISGAKVLGAIGVGAALGSLKAAITGAAGAAAMLGAPVAIAAAGIGALGAAAYQAGKDREFQRSTASMAEAIQNLHQKMAPVPPAAAQIAADFDRARQSLDGSSKATQNQADAFQDLDRAIQGPKTQMEEIFEINGRRRKNEAAKQLEELADQFETFGHLGPLVTYQYAQVGDQAEQLTFSQQLLKKAWDDLNESTRVSDGLTRMYYQTLRGLTSNESLQRMQKLAEAYKTIGYAPGGTDRLDDLTNAQVILARNGASQTAQDKAQLEVLKERQRRGERLTTDELRLLKTLEAANASAATKTQSVWTEAASRVRTGFTALSADLTKLILKGGNFGDVMVDALSKIGQSLMSLGIEKALGKILDMTGKLLKQIPGIGGALGKLGGIFGGGGGSGGGGSVPSIPSVGASAMGGLSGIFGSIGSIGSMVSGIIGNFQMGAMNSKLKAMESQLRGLLGQTIHNTERYNEFLPALPAIHQRLMEIRQIGVRVFTTDSPLEVMVAGGGLAGGGITINMEGSNFIGFRDLDAFLDELARRLRQRM